MGRDRLYEVIKSRFYWPSMYDDIRSWVKSCLECNKYKHFQPKHNGLLMPIRSIKPFQIVGIDHFGPLKITKDGNVYIAIFVDYFTSWVEAACVKTKYAIETADVFFREVVARHGCPEKIITDHGTTFTSGVFKHLASKYGITHSIASIKHPQANGKAERFIRFLENALALTIEKTQTDWDKMLDVCLFSYRTTMNQKIQETPFFYYMAEMPSFQATWLSFHPNTT